MNDRESLEMAAKAAGYEHPDGSCGLENEQGYPWDPLTDDGDALRLAVSLNLMVDCDTTTGMAQVAIPPHWLREPIGSDKYAATRRAIVRAAAKIGRSIK